MSRPILEFDTVNLPNAHEFYDTLQDITVKNIIKRRQQVADSVFFRAMSPVTASAAAGDRSMQNPKETIQKMLWDSMFSGMSSEKLKMLKDLVEFIGDSIWNEEYRAHLGDIIDRIAVFGTILQTEFDTKLPYTDPIDFALSWIDEQYQLIIAREQTATTPKPSENEFDGSITYDEYIVAEDPDTPDISDEEYAEILEENYRMEQAEFADSLEIDDSIDGYIPTPSESTEEALNALIRATSRTSE